MNVIPLNESFTGKRTKFNAESNEVRCIHATQHPELDNGARAILDWTFNFTDVKDSEVKELAAELLIIKARPAWKAAEIDHISHQFHVRQMLDVSRRKMDPVDKLAASGAKLSDSAKLELIAKLQASIS